MDELWQAIKRWFAPDPSLDVLAKILTEPHAREEMLGFRHVSPPSPEQVLKDIHRVLDYSRTEDYRIWAQEAWTHVLGSIDAILASKSSPETDFHRGRLQQTLTLLSISYKAHAMEPDLRRQAQAQKDRPLHPDVKRGA